MKRLYAALMASCLLHAVVLVMPYFGASTTVSRLPCRSRGHPHSQCEIGDGERPRRRRENSAAGAGAADSQGRRAADEEPRPAPERALGIDLLPIPAPAYYTTDQLTKRPQPISEPTLLTPELDPLIPSGKVVLKVMINELGKVISVEVEKSDVPEAVAASAAAAFGKLRFMPGEINGRPVGSILRIEVTYDDAARAKAAGRRQGSPP